MTFTILLVILALAIVVAPLVTLFLVLSLRRSFKAFDVAVFSLQNRLDRMKAEVDDLLQRLRAARPPTEVPPAAPAPIPPPPEPPSQTVRGAPWHEDAVRPPPIPAILPPAPPPVPGEPEAVPSGLPFQHADLQSPVPSDERFMAVRDILRRLWQWILVGEEYRPTAGVSLEYAVATTWLTRAGIMMLVACVGYFLKWSLDRELIGPFGRVALALCAGVGLLSGGIRMMTRRWHVLGQGFVGGGLAILYFALFAAGPRYHLLPTPGAFAAMILVTVAAGVLALRLNSLLVALFGLIGGFCTPILLSTGEPRFLALYAYLLLLNLGIVGIAYRRAWRLLHYLGFLFTYAIFFGAQAHGYVAARDFPVALTFLSLFFIAQSAIVWAHVLGRDRRSTVLEIVHLVANAGVYALTAYALIRDAVGRPWPSLMTLALAVFFIAQASVFLRRRLRDRPLLLTLLALAGWFTALTLPLMLEKESLTIAWSLTALLFLWLGQRVESRFIRQLGYALYGVVAFRLLYWDLPRHFPLSLAPLPPLAVYGQALLERLWTFGIAIGSIAAAFALERRAARDDAPADGAAHHNDTPDWVPSAIGGQAFFWGLIVLLFLFLQLECHALLGYCTPLRPAASTWLWCGLALYFLFAYRRNGRPVMLAALGVCVGATVVKSLGWDLPTWRVCDRGLYDMAYTGWFVAVRWLDWCVLLGLIFAAWRTLGRGSDTRWTAPWLGYGGLALLFLYATLEINSLLYWKLRDFQGGGVSVLWTAFALGFVAGGIRWPLRGLRYAGLILFVVVAGKVLLSDLADMPVIYRTIAFLAMGVLLLLGACAYVYAGKTFARASGATEPPRL